MYHALHGECNARAAVGRPRPGARRTGRDGVGANRTRCALIRQLHGQRRVAEEHVTAFFERHAQRLADEQSSEAGAVHEQVAFDLTRLLGRKAPNVAVFAKIHVPHIGEHMAHSQLFDAVSLKKRRELSGIEVISVIRDRLEFGCCDGLRSKAVVT